MTAQVLAASLILDHAIYPRHEINPDNVRDMVRAMEAGVRLPPVIACRKSRRVVDGWHRVRAVQKSGGEEAKIRVTWRDYESEAAILLDAIRLNAGHGRKLSKYDQIRCIVLGEELKIEPDVVAGALNITPARSGELRIRKTAFHGNGRIMPIKRTLGRWAGETLSPEQVAGNRRATGMAPLMYVNQVINLLQSDLIDEDNENLTAALEDLHKLLKKHMAKERVADAA